MLTNIQSAVIFVFLGELVTLTCQRVELTQGSWQFVRSRLLGSEERTIPLNQLQSAKVDANESSKGDTYRVVLLTDGDKVPFTSVWSSGAEEKQKNQTKLMLSLAILERHLCVFSKIIAGLLIHLEESLFSLVVG